LAAVLRLAPGRVKPWVWTLAVTLLSGLAGLSLAMSPRALERWAIGIITLGALVRGFQWARATPQAGSWGPRLKWTLAAAVLAGVVGETWIWSQESSFMSALPPGDPAKPNVLILILDTARADHLSSYGYGRATTPHMDSIAREGTRFEFAYSTSHWSNPGHTAILEGRYGRARVPNRLQKDTFQHSPLATVLARQGYATFATSANSMWFTPKAGFGHGFGRFNVYFHNLGDALGRTYLAKGLLVLIRDPGGWFDAPWRKRASQNNQELLAWMDRSQAAGRPFFAVANYMETHDPYWPPAPFTHTFNSRITRRGLLALHAGPFPRPDLTPEQLQTVVDAYDSSLAYLDAQLGDLFEQLRRRNILDKTIVVITADHGEALGEDGAYGHVAPIVRQEVSRVPLIVRYPPAYPAGHRVQRPVSIYQIPAMITSLLGLPDAALYPAEPLSPDAAVPGEGVLITARRRYAIALGRWFLLDNQRLKKRSLYDMQNDPLQKVDLAGRPEHAEVERALLERVVQLRAKLTPRLAQEAEAEPPPP
jgi:arylsulfatase A-like enzyme